MATVSDITTTPTSGLNHIDALLDTGPDWNYLTPAGNTLYYTFSILSGNEAGQTGQEGFTVAQQVATRTAFDYISKLTGIQFVEAVNGTDAQIHLCNTDLQGSNVTGLCSWHSSYTYSGTNLVGYDADAYVYLDNVEWFSQNRNLTPGGYGYETLLHELGHALGLKHPFDDDIHLPSSQDNTNNTLMSYTSAGGPHAAYGQYDIAALKWLYGTDGLGGALGINSITGARYITGTSGADTLTGTAANDTLEGDGGNDMIDGGSGIDTAVFRGVRSNYTFSALSNGDLQVVSNNGIDGTDTLRSVEILKFSDMSASRANVVAAAADITPPPKPTLDVTKNAAGYAAGSTPLVNGKGEVGATVKVYTSDNKLVGTATVDANGLWGTKLDPLADGKNYVIHATATDAAGNVSTVSDPVIFSVDATPPVSPTYSQFYTAGSNQISFTGTAEAGSVVELVRTVGGLQTIAHATTDASGHWGIDTAPIPNGSYTVSVISTDISGNNATNAKASTTWTVNSAANVTGTGNADVLKAGAGNNAVDGGGGIDTVVYAGSKNNFTVNQADWGFDIVDKTGVNGHDSLINVERIQFDDGYVAIDDHAAQIYRLYSATYGREPDAAGMGYWIQRMDSGTIIQQVSREFMLGGEGKGQPEFVQMYGANSTDSTFLTQLYHNILGRDPDAGGYQYWMDVMNNYTADKTILRGQMLIDFSDSPENLQKVALVGTLEHGVSFVPFHG
jgi:serralysin